MSSANGRSDGRRAALAMGAEAEQLVADRLSAEGWTVLERNWRARGGELDVVAERDGRLRFVEVKARTPLDTLGWESVTPSKQRKLIRAADAYLAQRPGEPAEACFLVALVSCEAADWSVEWIDNAFDGG